MSFIRTYTGKNFDLLNIACSEIDIEDIAHSLSNLCRFTGHTKSFYSVAQHSVIVSEIVEAMDYGPKTQLMGLLHDATEAYLTDISRPLKLLSAMKGYRKLEEELEKRIALHFGFSMFMTIAIKEADHQALATEARDLMGNPADWEYLKNVKTWGTIVPLSPDKAKKQFLKRYEQLTKKVGIHGAATIASSRETNQEVNRNTII